MFLACNRMMMMMMMSRLVSYVRPLLHL